MSTYGPIGNKTQTFDAVLQQVPSHDWDILTLEMFRLSVSNNVQIQCQTVPCYKTFVTEWRKKANMLVKHHCCPRKKKLHPLFT